MKINLHQRQSEIFYDPTRFKVVAAGRRFGKSYLAAVTLFIEASKTSKTRSDGVVVDLSLEEVYYVAPTFDQGKKILWPLLKELGWDLVAKTLENTGELTLINGRRISIKGSDRPDSLRGVGLSYVVLDEYAFMKETVWELIILPALTRTEGGALFIGTPDGKNHFWKLWEEARTGRAGSDWKAWHFPSTDNPFLPMSEIAAAQRRMAKDRYKQEYEASFEGGAGLLLTRDMFPRVKVQPTGDYYIAIDLAGFESNEGGRKVSKLDDHANAVVKNHEGGWLIVDIIHGKWDVRETALRIVKAFRDYRPLRLGIEKGMAKNAVLPYLNDEMNRLGVYFQVEELSHGNKNKTDRLVWALQGRAEKKRIQLFEDDDSEWIQTFLEQAEDFPSPLAHDDLLDAVAYIDQLAEPFWDGPSEIDNWQPQDMLAGY